MYRASLTASLHPIPSPSSSQEPLAPLRSFPQAISSSLLRKVCLSSTPFSLEAFCHLLDNLDAPCLHELRLPLTLSSTPLTKEQSRRAALSVARLVRPKTSKRSSSQDDLDSSDESQEPSSTDSTAGGNAPALEVLTLNGNALTLRGVKMIVAAVLGGPASPPNRVLTQVELFATSGSDEVDSDVEDGDDDRKSRASGSVHNRLRTLSIARSYVEEKNRRRSTQQHDELPSSPSSSSKRRPHLEPDDPKAYSHITAENWRRLLGSHLWKNAQSRSSVIATSQLLLAKARVLGCRSSPGPDLENPLSLHRLPPELRLAILKKLDDVEMTLSSAQFQRVLAWACEGSTIGYGSPAFGLSSSATPSTISEFPTLLPCQTWSWSEMIKTRSYPRDWTAESWDQWNDVRDTLPIIGGGGGPDGEGGSTMEDFDTAVAARNGSGTGSRTRTGTRGRGTVIDLFRKAPDPAWMAFLEATGTRAAE